MSRFDAAAAIGGGNVAGKPGGPYTEASGLMPSFPSTDHLTRSSFIVTVSSTAAQRLNHATPAPTNDFVCHVGRYAPSTTPVTRVQLVDVDIPCTQRLIEQPWRNLYFGQGVYTSADVRAITVTVHTGVSDAGDGSDESAPGPSLGNFGIGSGLGLGIGGRHVPCDQTVTGAATATVVLPLLLDRVKAHQKLSDTNCTVRIVTESRAPYPIDPIARAWRAMATMNCGDLRLVGPTIGGLALVPGQVYDDGPFSFVVQLPRSVYEALGEEDVLYLYAAPLPGPGYLAAVLTRALTSVMGLLCPPWPQFAVEYDLQQDRFSLYARAPTGTGLDPVPVTLAGGLASYMGFGSSFRAELSTRRGVTVPAPGLRLTALGDPGCFAEVQCGSPATPAAFAAWVQAAMNTYTWPAEAAFTITVLGHVPVTVGLPSGQATLEDVAEWLTGVLSGLGLDVGVTVVYTPPTPGLTFFSASVLFTLDFTGLSPEYAARLGYDPVVLGPVGRQAPTLGPASVPHIPQLEVLCGPPRSGFQVLCRSLETDQMVFRSVPFAPMLGEVVLQADGTGTVALGGPSPNVLHGLQVGAVVALVDAATDVSITAYVTSVTGLQAFDVVCGEGLPDPVPVFDRPIQVVPLDAPPLDLYFGANIQAFRALLPDVCGFQPQTYESCGGPLAAPGTISILQDPFVVVCLGFDGTEGEPLTGDVYYPLAAAPLVFAKVPRTTLFKSDFFKVYDHTFEGAGRTLGFIQVRILNPNGTLYQTHGHIVMVTLLFNTRQTMVGFGHGRATITYDGAAPPMYPDMGATRQVVPIGGGRGGMSVRS